MGGHTALPPAPVHLLDEQQKAARPSPGCAAAPPSATSARRARRAGASRSGSGSRPTTRMSFFSYGLAAYAGGDYAEAASAAKFAAGHAFKDADKRRLFGDHLVLAGLPE